MYIEFYITFSEKKKNNVIRVSVLKSVLMRKPTVMKKKNKIADCQFIHDIHVQILNKILTEYSIKFRQIYIERPTYFKSNLLWEF